MFASDIYVSRRKKLKEEIHSGLALFMGNEESPRNFPANPYKFRQDSTFLYFFGLDSPGLAGIVNADEDQEILFGREATAEDVVWAGPQPLLKDRALLAGVGKTLPLDKLEAYLKKAKQQKRQIHYLPPYRQEISIRLGNLLGIPAAHVGNFTSLTLIKAVIRQRLVKIKEEIDEIERAVNITRDMYLAGMKICKSRIYEREIVGKMEGIAIAAGSHMAFPTALTMNAGYLNNFQYGNMLEKGRLVLCDCGAESPMHYASDITRTVPVDGEFTRKQKEIYEIVLKAQLQAIQNMKPGVKFRDIHMQAARTITCGLKDLGLMSGDIDEAVEKGAYALFFPHGVGHLVGLDVHDMEDLGEDLVGYNTNIKRSDQFGLAQLRYAKALQEGLVLTAEPGIYFNPTLFDRWKAQNKYSDFINYNRVEKYRNFGGIRIEDDVLITEKSSRILGTHIPKTVTEIANCTGK